MCIKKNNIISLILTLLFTVYYGCITLFPHVHYVNNIPITHSHPYSNPSHSHSSAAMTIISELSNITLTIPSLIICLTVFRNIITLLQEKAPAGYIHREVKFLRLRAPPVL